jgi:putative NADPH-quinone reductase
MKNLQDSVIEGCNRELGRAVGKGKNRPYRLKTSMLAVTAGSNPELYHAAMHNSCVELTPDLVAK